MPLIWIPMKPTNDHDTKYHSMYPEVQYLKICAFGCLSPDKETI